MGKNIVDVYKETHGQFIILVSGLSSTGKTKLGINIERDFNIKRIDMKNFMNEKNTETVELPNGKFVINTDKDDAVDWDKLNEEVNKDKKDGVVVVGTMFPTDLLKFKADYHIHLRLPKQILKTKREEYIKSHPDKKYNLEDEMLRINMITYPYYMNVLNRMLINKYLNIAEMKPDDIYDVAYDAIIKHIWENIPPPQKKESIIKKELEKADSISDPRVDPYSEGDPIYGMYVKVDDC
jgi:cytidylate kinase